MAPKQRVVEANLPTIATTSRANRTNQNTGLSMKDPSEKNPSTPNETRNFIYNREKGTCCKLTWQAWVKMTAYTIMFMIFIATFTIIFLYGSLAYIKTLPIIASEPGFDLIYSQHSIGLTATPTSENSYPLIWYRNGEADDYQKYIYAIDKLLVEHKMFRSDDNNLGPCGQSPYGYGVKPCVLVRINRNLRWVGRPLQPDSTIKDIPDDVRNWMKSDKKYWLHCTGYHSFDKEHIGKITYHPNPPGFDPKQFPMDTKRKSPLVAVQISNFTLGLSLSIECKLWCESGVSSVAFVLYVTPMSRSNQTHSHARW